MRGILLDADRRMVEQTISVVDRRAMNDQDDAPPPIGAEPDGASWLPVALTALAVLSIITVGLWTSYHAPLRNDQYQLIQLGQCVREGGRLYVDCWENKPPGVAWINALGIVLSGGGQIGAWILPGVSLAFAATLFGLSAGFVLSRAAGCISAILASILFTLRAYDAPAINPDFYSATLELAAVSLLIVALGTEWHGRRLWLGLTAGLLAAAATCVKQTGFIGLFVFTAVVAGPVLLRRPHKRGRLLTIGYAWTGVTAGAVATIVALAYRNHVADAWSAVVLSNRNLLTLDSLSTAVASWSHVADGLVPIQLPLWLGFVAIIAWRPVNRSDVMSRSLIAALVLWWFAQITLALIGPSRSMRYWQAAFPPALWIAAIGIQLLSDTFGCVQRRHRAPLTLLTLTVLLLLGRPLWRDTRLAVARAGLESDDPDSERNRYRKMGQAIAEGVPQGKRIYVLAYDTGIYVFANRRPASRFTYPRSESHMKQIVADLQSGAARLILKPKRPAAAFDRWCDDACHADLDALLAQYQPVDPIGNYAAYIPKPALPSP